MIKCTQCCTRKYLSAESTRDSLEGLTLAAQFTPGCMGAMPGWAAYPTGIILSPSSPSLSLFQAAPNPADYRCWCTRVCGYTPQSRVLVTRARGGKRFALLFQLLFGQLVAVITDAEQSPIVDCQPHQQRQLLVQTNRGQRLASTPRVEMK